MLSEIKKALEEKYRNEREIILKKNNEYLRKYQINIERPSQIEFSFFKSVIPKIKGIRPYKFYMHIEESVVTGEDPVLRFIPFIPREAEYEEFTLFEESDLAEKPFDYETHINESLMKEIFKRYRDFEIHNLKSLYNLKKLTVDYLKKDFIHLIEFSQFSNLSIPKILKWWENDFDKRKVSLFPDPDSLTFYFCNVCYKFDCGIHDGYQDLNFFLEKKYDNLNMKKIHSKFCLPNSSNKQVLNLVRQKYEREIKLIEAKGDFGCISNLYFFYCTNEFLPHNFFTTKNSKFKEKIFLHHSTKKKKSTYFYHTCHHLGSCNNNLECSCSVEKMYCEQSCLCETCDNYFLGCKCIVCDDKCRCAKEKRGCIEFCECKNCPNTYFNLESTCKTYIGTSFISGYGLFAAQDISKDSFICEYVGELITHSEAERRGHFYEKRQLSYLFDLCSVNEVTHHTLDAMIMGNNSRFANHSSTPNAVAVNYLINGIRRIGFFALKKIRKHREIVFDYGYTQENIVKYKFNDNKSVKYCD